MNANITAAIQQWHQQQFSGMAGRRSAPGTLLLLSQFNRKQLGQ